MALKIGIGGNSRSGGGGASTADAVSYDNSKSGLQSTNVQDAIDEVGANLGGFSLWGGTQVEYNKLPSIEHNKFYFIK